MNTSFSTSTKLVGLLLLAFCPALLTGCSVREAILRQVVSEMDGYFSPPELTGVELEQHTENVYAFRWGWYRMLVLDTEEGLVVVDPMTVEGGVALKKALDEKFPGRKVHTLIYSHYHLDHASGGAVLEPGEVIAHKDCPEYWKDLETADILKPTRYIEGDQTLNIGGVEIQMLYLGDTHTDTIYAFHLPAERVLFTADVGLVRTFPPNGYPDAYIPGAEAAMERLAALDFDIFLPSHFGYGTKQDLVDYLEFTSFSREIAYKTVTEVGHPGDPALLDEFMDAMYYPMKEKYGDWHGFEQMILIHSFRAYTGELLGY